MKLHPKEHSKCNLEREPGEHSKCNSERESDRIGDFVRDSLPAICLGQSSSDAGYALPQGSLAVLRECVARLGVRRVFEFGTGLSTRAFLDAGCEVTAVEDSAEWLAETRRSLEPAALGRVSFFHLSLRIVWHRGAPIRSWRLPPEALAALRAAELVLVDSPALPPFREHALIMAIEHARNALIVVDDAGIPTVARFCRRLAERNNAAFFQTTLDHGLFFMIPAAHAPLDDSRPLLETLKAWRRCFHPRAGAKGSLGKEGK